jgi:Leucine-rich repeat (LRR) protein
MLSFGETNVNDAVLTEIKEIKTLTVLDLNYLDSKSVTEVGLKEIGGLSNLIELSLPGHVLTDDALAAISKCKKLKGFEADFSKLTPAAGKHLREMKQLTRLSLGFCKIGDEGAAGLMELTNLTDLDVRDAQITDAGIKDIAKLKNLTSLVLNGNKGITDASINQLLQLKKLTDLDLNELKITPEGVKMLQMGLPKCKIMRP